MITLDQIEEARAPLEERYTEKFKRVLEGQGRLIIKAVLNHEPVIVAIEGSGMEEVLEEMYLEITPTFARMIHDDLAKDGR